MPRYDKYEPKAGGFRAPLGEALTVADDQVDVILGFGLNASGRAVIGGGTTGIIGVAVADQAKNLLDVMDIMTSGEIIDLPDDVNPGDVLYADAATGALSTTNSGAHVGYVVADQSTTGLADNLRLVVRFRPSVAV